MAEAAVDQGRRRRPGRDLPDPDRARRATRQLREDVKLSPDGYTLRQAEEQEAHHASAVKDIEKFQLAHVGTGTGLASEGYGLYASSRRRDRALYLEAHAERTGQGDVGRIYKIAVPSDDVLLHYRKTLSEQPERIRTILEGAGLLGDGKQTGQELYKALKERLAGERPGARRDELRASRPGRFPLPRLARDPGRDLSGRARPGRQKAAKNFLIWREAAFRMNEPESAPKAPSRVLLDPGPQLAETKRLGDLAPGRRQLAAANASRRLDEIAAETTLKNVEGNAADARPRDLTGCRRSPSSSRPATSTRRSRRPRRAPEGGREEPQVPARLHEGRRARRARQGRRRLRRAGGPSAVRVRARPERAPHRGRAPARDDGVDRASRTPAGTHHPGLRPRQARPVRPLEGADAAGAARPALGGREHRPPGRAQEHAPRAQQRRRTATTGEGAARRAAARRTPSEEVPARGHGREPREGARQAARPEVRRAAVERIINQLDGGDINGPWHRYVWDPINDGDAPLARPGARRPRQIVKVIDEMPPRS
jgi:hypothetical protein